VFLNFLFDKLQDTRSPARFTALGEGAATLDLDSADVRSFIQLLADTHTVIDPTVPVFHSLLTDRVGTVSVAYAAIANRLPSQIRRSLLEGGLPVPEGQDQQYRAAGDALLRMTKRLYDAGITPVAGTDAVPDFTLQGELEMYVRAGVPAPEACIAMLNAAKVLAREAKPVSIAPGKLADMIRVEGDPARRISHVGNTGLVIKDGKLYESALYRSIGVLPR